MTFESTQKSNDPKGLEKAIEHHIENLPAPLQKKWAAEYERAQDNELGGLETKLRELLEQRDRVLHTAPGMLGEFKHSAKDEERIRATLARIEAAASRADMYVGEGKTAEVYRDPEESSVCYKQVVNFEKYQAWNSIGKEAHFLEELEDFEVEGVRTPRVISVIDLPQVKALSMEYLDGENIEVLIKRRKPLPADFDVDVFFNRVRAYVNAMHEKNIYHRDLHGGNILVGKDGTPYIVDFGQAEFCPSAEHAYEAYDRTGQNKVILTSDEAYLDATEAALRAYARQLKAA